MNYVVSLTKDELKFLKESIKMVERSICDYSDYLSDSDKKELRESCDTVLNKLYKAET
jgi:hypothetical protein